MLKILPILIRRVHGNSMVPTFKPGTLVFARRYFSPHVGQVVIARQAGREVIKRISAIDNDRFYLRGDNPDQSSDSRTYGSVGNKDLLGSVIWPRTN